MSDGSALSPARQKLLLEAWKQDVAAMIRDWEREDAPRANPTPEKQVSLAQTTRGRIALKLIEQGISFTDIANGMGMTLFEVVQLARHQPVFSKCDD